MYQLIVNCGQPVTLRSCTQQASPPPPASLHRLTWIRIHKNCIHTASGAAHPPGSATLRGEWKALRRDRDADVWDAPSPPPGWELSLCRWKPCPPLGLKCHAGQRL
ncbi:hypothetical protein JOB18_045921 [Solea senegalensis]|uniref:Uncharacterized protein n=1 Tax=Solea senegalensis TaxID=28829 RepID=A0AAV6RVF4_SOLSE|nr:hypothetical protein JOB18_045921 [Solea senegalensis]